MNAYKSNNQWYVDVTNNGNWITSDLINSIRNTEEGEKDFLTDEEYNECIVYSDSTVECFADNDRMDLIILVGYEGV